MKTCTTCHFWNGKICTDPKDFFGADGASVCRYHSDAVEAQPKRKPLPDGTLELTKEELEEFKDVLAGKDDMLKRGTEVLKVQAGGNTIEARIRYRNAGTTWHTVSEYRAILYLANLFDLEVNNV